MLVGGGGWIFVISGRSFVRVFYRNVFFKGGDFIVGYFFADRYIYVGYIVQEVDDVIVG